jgi:hypothetical protein
MMLSAIIAAVADTLRRRPAGEVAAAPPAPATKNKGGRPPRRNATKPVLSHDENRDETHETLENRHETISTSSLDIDIDDDSDGDARERGVIKFKVQVSEIANRATDEIEQVVKSAGKWPKGGWNRSVTAAQVAELMRQGIGPQLIIDTVRVVTSRAPGKISKFKYFHAEIGMAHQEAAEQLVFRFPPVKHSDQSVKRGDRPTQHDNHTPARHDLAEAAAELVELAPGALSEGAAKGAQLLVNLCRTQRDIADPRPFVAAVAHVLNGYPPEVVREVTDPKTGLPGKLRYPLEIADVKRACEDKSIFHAMSEWVGPATSQPDRVHISPRTHPDQWAAWRRHKGKPLPTDSLGGWYVDSEWPPGQAAGGISADPTAE